MNVRIATVGVGLFFLLACSGDGPADLERSALAPDDASFKQGATGAIPGTPDDLDLAAIDDAGNGDGVVCVKTVPAGKGNGAERTIAMDNKNGTCPGGFEEQTLVTELPACTEEGQSVEECDCEAAGGIEFNGQCFFAG